MVDLRLPLLVDVIPDPEAKLQVERFRVTALAQGVATLTLVLWGDLSSLLWVFFSAYYTWSAISDIHVVRTQAMGAIISTSYFVVLAGLYDILLPILALLQEPQRKVHFNPDTDSRNWFLVLFLSLKIIHYGVAWLLVIRYLLTTWETFELLHTSTKCRGVAPSQSEGLLQFPSLRWNQGQGNGSTLFAGQGRRTIDV